MRYLNPLLLTTAIFFLISSCKKADTTPATTGGDLVYKGFAATNKGPIHIYTKDGEITDQAIINSYIAHHARDFVPTGATLATDALDSVFLVKKSNGDINFQGIDLAATYNGTTVSLHEKDTSKYSEPSSDPAWEVQSESAYWSMINLFVNTYNSVELDYIDPANSGNIVMASLYNFQFEYVADTFYLPSTNTLYSSEGVDWRIGYYHPCYATPLALPALGPKDTVAVQQGTIKAVKI